MKSYQGWNPILHLSEPAASHSSPSTSLCLVKLYLYLLWLHQYSLLAWHPGCFWQAAALTPHSFHPWGFPPDREHGCSFGCSTPPLCPLSLWGSAPQGPNPCPTGCFTAWWLALPRNTAGKGVGGYYSCIGISSHVSLGKWTHFQWSDILSLQICKRQCKVSEKKPSLSNSQFLYINWHLMLIKEQEILDML